MGTILYNIFIMPIELFIEIVFNVMNLALRSPGFSIIFVSIAVQLLCFPLYKRADAIQEQDRQKQKEMKPWLDHIKKTFKGDERFMMQQTYYRIENYKPIYAVKGSISLLLQIPFFIAAYNFLSNLELLENASFLGIADLSKPDQLIHIGALSLNLLPILMTLFNIISGIIYTKGFPLKDKIQTYGLAVIFLLLLYKSPSGLVFYWTLNNLFSLLKNVFMKLIKNPKKVIKTILLVFGIIVPIYIILFSSRGKYLKFISIILGFICIAPTVVPFIREALINNDNKKIKAKTENIKLINSVFYTSITVIFILLALVIPVSLIKLSPTEFISVSYSPFGLILRVTSIYIGFLFVWINIFYIFSSEKIRKWFAAITGIMAIIFPVNYFFFAKNLGTISAYLIYNHKPDFSISQIGINLLVVAVIVLVVLVLYLKKAEILKRIYQIAILTFAVTAVLGFVSIEKTLAFEGHPEKHTVEESTEAEDEQIFKFSKNGKNVVVLMLDRAISGYVPYIIDDHPELKEIYDGFTYYPNTISYGGSTNYGTPALFGGYEYTPTEIDRRKDETLASKQNEALTVLPKLFSDNKYNVTVCDPPYAGYRWIPNLSIYDKFENIKAYNTIGAYSGEYKMKYSPLYEKEQVRNFVFYSLMKSLPVAAQDTVYQGGFYWSSSPSVSSVSTFLDSYTVLEKLESLTEISDGSANNFLILQNSTTHDPMLLQEPDLIPSVDAEMPDYTSKTAHDGTVLHLDTREDISHYQANVCSLIKVGNWLEYLKSNGIYDNTRIIIVSDHGRDLGQFDNMKLENGIDVEAYNPLLLIKDFNATGFTVSDEFMTNADTPYFAVNRVIDNPVNPFTGKVISNAEKTAHAQIITTSENFDITHNNGNTFDTSDGEWWSVEKNIFDEKNWKKVEVE